jgi:predicted RNA-binding protein YlxR (DUF448 family)
VVTDLSGNHSVKSDPRPEVIRTCIGCRQRSVATDLLRVVVSLAEPGQVRLVRADPRRRGPGRGAWLHPSPGCLELAERRRAFGRALRVQEPVDSAPVRDYLAARQIGDVSSW